MSHSLEEKIRARELFVESGCSYEEVAGETGISVSVLKNWGKEGNWTGEREEYEHDVMDLSVRLRKTTLKKMREIEADPNDQKIYALRTLLQATFNQRKKPGIDKAAFLLEVIERLVKFLGAKDPEALRYLQPHIRAFAEEMKEN